MRLNDSYQHDKNAEIAYLEELIATYSEKSDWQAEEAIENIYTRFQELEKKRSQILPRLTNSPDGYYQFCLWIHGFLYNKILGNAGKFRDISDPNGGNVYFGGINYRTMKNKFTGTKPASIKLELSEAFKILFNAQFTPVEASIRFYAEFVAIHPFYDANGRISRYIIDTYLQDRNYYVDWQSINKKHGKFLRKLNYCHSVRAKQKEYSDRGVDWQSIREKYIAYLVNFWSQFVEFIDDSEINSLM